MLLAIDIGNTNAVLGIYDGDTLVDHLRLESRHSSTRDEYAAVLAVMLQQRNIQLDRIHAAIIGSVVPALTEIFETVCERLFGVEPLTVGPGIRTGMKMQIENPREVGADRIVNAVAAFEQARGCAIVVDFGTATTFDVVSVRGDYLGGVIVPGVGISADALASRTAKLPRVEIARPKSVIGRTTVQAIQSGLVFGYVALIEGLVHRISEQMSAKPRVIATGGLASLIARETDVIDDVVEFLTLDGLRMVWLRNKERRPAVTVRRGRH